MTGYNNETLNNCAWFAEKHRGKNKQSGAHWSTIIRFTPLFDEAVRLQNQVRTLLKSIEIGDSKQLDIDILQARVQDLEAVNEDQVLTISQNDYAYTIDREMMEKRIAELEQERRWIHQDKTMIVKKDGDSWCFVLPDFKDLQRSEAKFMDVVVSGFLDKIYTNLIPQPPQEDE